VSGVNPEIIRQSNRAGPRRARVATTSVLTSVTRHTNAHYRFNSFIARLEKAMNGVRSDTPMLSIKILMHMDCHSAEIAGHLSVNSTNCRGWLDARSSSTTFRNLSSVRRENVMQNFREDRL
jgi:hypothetical protein